MSVTTLARPKNYKVTWMATQPEKEMTKTKLFIRFYEKLAAYGINPNDTRWDSESKLWNSLSKKTYHAVDQLVLEHAEDCDLQTLEQLNRGW